MGGAKPWQIVVIVLGVGALLWVGVGQLAGSSMSETQQDFVMVDVQTGELFKIYRPADRSLAVPNVRPGSDQLSLYPVEQVDGAWVVPDKYRHMLTKDMAAVVDKSAGQIKTQGEPVELDLFK